MELNEVCDFIIDCPHSTAEDEGEGYPLIRTPNIGKGRLILNGVHRVNEDVYRQRIARGTPQDDDLIFAREAPAGNVAIVKNGETVCLGQRTVLLRPNQDEANPVYLTYYLLAPEQQYRLVGRANGSTVAHVNLPTIRGLKIELPEMPVQNRIASILSAYDELIEKSNHKIAILQEQAQELYKEWFVRFRFPGHETAKLENGLPEGWKNGRVEDLCSFVRGKNVTADEMEEGTVPVISAGVEPSGFHSESNVSGVSITVSSSGANAGYISIHYSSVWAADCSYINAKPNMYYLYEMLNCIRPNVFNLQRGAAQPHVYPKDINRLKLIIPDAILQMRFNALAEKMHTVIALLEQENGNLRRQRDLLLPRLMSGKLEV